MASEIDLLKIAFGRTQWALGFLKSIAESGGSWTEQAQASYDRACEEIDRAIGGKLMLTAADMRERAAKLIIGHATAAHLSGLSGLGCKLDDLAIEARALPLDGGDGE